MHQEAQQLVEKPELKPHPEGGFYRETFRSELELSGLPYGGVRNVSTAIYFLLLAGTFSAFHTVKSDEIWHHYSGEALNLHIISPSGEYQRIRLGSDIQSGETSQAIVPAGYL